MTFKLKLVMRNFDTYELSKKTYEDILSNLSNSETKPLLTKASISNFLGSSFDVSEEINHDNNVISIIVEKLS